MEPKGCLSHFLGFSMRKPRRAVLPPIIRLRCGHCREENVVVGCKSCDKHYVITTAHIQGRVRDDEAGPVSHVQAILSQRV